MPDELSIADEYRKARALDPELSYATFVWERHLAYARAGNTHASIGKNLIKGDWEEAGSGLFKLISRRVQIKPESRVVDYGCGTARLGYHVIRQVDPGNYFGLDVSPAILDHGKELLGPDLIASRRPRFAPITPESVAEAAEFSPHVVISSAVSFHVHPNEVAGYYGNMVRIAHQPGARVCFDARVSNEPQVLNRKDRLPDGLSWVVTWSWQLGQIRDWMKPLVLEENQEEQKLAANSSVQTLWLVFRMP